MAVSKPPFTPFVVTEVYTAAQKAEMQANIEAFVRKFTHGSGDNFPFFQQMPLHVSEGLALELTALNDQIQAS